MREALKLLRAVVWLLLCRLALMLAGQSAGTIASQFKATRELTEKLCEPLAVEDYVIQSMPDVSPPKWHLAHTTWFFETFVVAPRVRDYRPVHRDYHYLFNSYYERLGPHIERSRRGLLSRPTIEEIYFYREVIDGRVLEVLLDAKADELATIVDLITLGLQHEQQHQELLLMDIKYNFWNNPLRPAYRREPPCVPVVQEPTPLSFMRFPGGITKIGFEGADFRFDNECPRHRTYVEDYRLGSRLVTAGEYLEFIEEGGYNRCELWLSDGWTAKERNAWSGPLYWERSGEHWWVMTLAGMKPIDPAEPVAHLSYYEADAYARFRDARLPTEAEWENAAASFPIRGNFLESGLLHPARAGDLPQFYGDLWEWTSSGYQPYPGFKPLAGALGEYNGKFMANQMVLRGGACLTPASHIRSSYRNYFFPESRWAFTGLRLGGECS